MNYIEIEKIPASPGSLSKRKTMFDMYINDAPFNTSITRSGNRLNHEGYQAWIHMIHRSCGKVSTHYPSYQGVSVCDEWRYFMNFRSWWVENYREGWCLDKDLIGNGKIYSPDVCIYIPQQLNKLLNVCSAKRGEVLLGVYKSGRNFGVAISNPISGRHERIGGFKTEQEAHATWRERKLRIISDMKGLMDSIDLRIFPSVVSKVNEIF